MSRNTKGSNPKPQLPNKVKAPAQKLAAPKQSTSPQTARELAGIFNPKMPDGVDAEIAKVDKDIRFVTGYWREQYAAIARIACDGVEDTFRLDQARDMLEEAEYYAELTTRALTRIQSDYTALVEKDGAELTPGSAWEIYVNARALAALFRAIGGNAALYAPTRSAIYAAAVQSMPNVDGVLLKTTL